MTTTWVAVDGTDIENRDGLWWSEWPAPPREHDHFAASRGYTTSSSMDFMERCPCGAIRYNRRAWFFATRDDQPERVAEETAAEEAAVEHSERNPRRMAAARSWARRSASHFLAALAGLAVVGLCALAQWDTAVDIVWRVSLVLGVLAIGEAAVTCVLRYRAKR